MGGRVAREGEGAVSTRKLVSRLDIHCCFGLIGESTASSLQNKEIRTY